MSRDMHSSSAYTCAPNNMYKNVYSNIIQKLEILFTSYKMGCDISMQGNGVQQGEGIILQI